MFKQNISQNDPISCMSQIFFPLSHSCQRTALRAPRSTVHSQGVPHGWGLGDTEMGGEGRAAAISNGPRKGPVSRGKYYFSALHGTCGSHVSHPSRVSSSAGSLPSRCAEAHHLREQSVLETAPRKKSAPSRASLTRGFVLYLTDDFT